MDIFILSIIKSTKIWSCTTVLKELSITDIEKSRLSLMLLVFNSKKLPMKLLLILALFRPSILFHFSKLMKEPSFLLIRLSDIWPIVKENSMEDKIFTARPWLINGLISQSAILKLLLLRLLLPETENKLMLHWFQKTSISSWKSWKDNWQVKST